LNQATGAAASFDRTSRYFFWVAGAVTALGALPVAVSPVGGFRLALGLDYFAQSPQLFPVIGHWGVMVAGLGVLMFVAATRKELRRTTIIFATVEKAYIVAMILYCFLSAAPYAANYLVPLVADGAMTIGGIWYLLRSRSLQLQ
jgi:hypothetical protein